MADKISKARRSWVMSRVSGKHTKPERIVRSLLHRLGFRFTVNGPKNRSLAGHPDIVLPSRKTVIFVHGCFWHRHPGCKTATTPKSNTVYWENKFQRNIERDREVTATLETQGWQVLVIWECQLKQLDEVAAMLISSLPRSSYSDLPEEVDDQLLVAETRVAPYGKKSRRS